MVPSEAFEHRVAWSDLGKDVQTAWETEMGSWLKLWASHRVNGATQAPAYQHLSLGPRGNGTKVPNRQFWEGHRWAGQKHQPRRAVTREGS